jgi:outer membrane lipoprotein-sorting protein
MNHACNRSRVRRAAVLLLAAGLSLAAADQPAGNQLNAAEVIKKVEDLMRGDTSYSEMKMTVYNPAWPGPREYEMRSWDERKSDRSFIRITAPARDRGKAFLKDGKVFKVYIPTERENKPMTIPPSLMLQPWMGSDFTNDDLVRESSIINDYTQIIEGTESEGGKNLVRVRLDPKPEAPVVWGKIVYWVDADAYVPVRELYYDEDGKPVREMVLSEVKNMDGRNLPTVWEMKNLDPEKKGQRTVITIGKIQFNLTLDPQLFTEKNLTRRDWD